MTDTQRLTVTLPRAQVERLRRSVALGAFASVSDAVAAAVAQADAGAATDAATLRRLVDEGLASGPPLDADQVFAALRARAEAVLIDARPPL
jgi:antitoxin ParD1/3/4